MSRDELIQEILKRVMQKILEYERSNSPSSNSCNSAPTPASTPSPSCTQHSTQSSACAGSTMQVDKRLLSERDVIEAVKNGVQEIHYSRKTIVTDSAKDYAARHKLKLIRE